jgi:hypothetical protein
MTKRFKIGDLVKSHYSPFDDEFSHDGIGVVVKVEDGGDMYCDYFVYWASIKTTVFQHKNELDSV